MDLSQTVHGVRHGKCPNFIRAGLFVSRFYPRVNFEIVTKQRNLSANTMFTTITG